MSEAERMQQHIDKLEGELRVAQLRCKTLEDGAQGQSDNIVVNYSKDRKIVKFKQNDDIDEWVKNVELYVKKKFSNEEERVSFIADHLDEDVKTEIRLDIDMDKSTSTEFLDLLKNIYSIKQTIFELQQEFYGREQLANESLHDYSHVLMKLMVLMKKKAPEMYLETDKILKQRFAEGVQDVSLRRELKRLNKEALSLKFFQLRDEALSWIKESKPETKEIESLKELTSINQQQIHMLTQAMQEQTDKVQRTAEIAQQRFDNSNYNGFFNSRSRSRGRSRGVGRGNSGYYRNQKQPSDKGSNNEPKKDDTSGQRDPIICHYCSELNHIAPFCWKKRQDLKKQKAQSKSSN